MPEHGLPPPLPYSSADLLQGPIALAAGLLGAALMGFYGVGLLYPAPLAVAAGLSWFTHRKRRNAERGQGHPGLIGYLLLFALWTYLIYGLGVMIADQFY